MCINCLDLMLVSRFAHFYILLSFRKNLEGIDEDTRADPKELEANVRKLGEMEASLSDLRQKKAILEKECSETDKT